MSSYLEELRSREDARRKLGPDFSGSVSTAIREAHALRDSADHVPFDEGLKIASGKSRLAYGAPKI